MDTRRSLLVAFAFGVLGALISLVAALPEFSVPCGVATCLNPAIYLGVALVYGSMIAMVLVVMLFRNRPRI